MGLYHTWIPGGRDNDALAFSFGAVDGLVQNLFLVNG